LAGVKRWAIRAALIYIGVTLLALLGGLVFPPLMTVAIGMITVLLLLVVIYLTAEGWL